MKKPVFTLFFLCLSFALSAQTSSYYFSEPQALFSAEQAADHAVESAQATDALTAAFGTWEQKQFSHNSSPTLAKGHKVPNRAYSVRGGVSYTTGTGIRVSSHEAGVSIKHFFRSNEAIETILSTGWQYTGNRLTGLYEVQQPIGSEGLYWYWGLGAHAGLFKGNYWTGTKSSQEAYQSNGNWYSSDSNRYTLGLSGILGIEYHFAEAPFTVGIDLKPSVDLLGMSHRYGEGAFSIRYAF